MFVSWKHFWILCVLRILWVYSSYDLMILKYCLSQCGLIGSCVIRWPLPTRRTIVKSTWHRHFSAVCHRHLSAMSPALSRLHKKLSEQVPIPTKRFFCKHRIWCIVVASWRLSWSPTCTRTYCFSFAVWRWPLKLPMGTCRNCLKSGSWRHSCTCRSPDDTRVFNHARRGWTVFHTLACVSYVN